MADDTRVTYSRLGLACAIALLCVIGCSLPGVARAAGDDRQWQQWALENKADLPLYPTAILDADIDAPEAWEIMEGQGVTVAVVDQVVYAHPDLGGNVEAGENFTQPDGCTAGDPTGPDDHGTMVAGVIAAKRDNGGIAGVAPLAHVMPLRAIDNCGTGELQWILKAFEYAGSKQVPIVTASFGSDPLDGPNAKTNQQFVDVFDRFPNTLFVVAAGNEGNDNDDPAHPVYPCSTRRPGANPEIPNLLCVGMTDNRDNPACSGNVGQSSVDLFAPGVSILSTVRGGFGGYAYGNGTSMAAPMVAAAAAIVLSIEPRLGAGELAQRLIGAVDRKDALAGISVAGGRLNAARSAGVPGRLGSGGGESQTWKSCDRDHDGFRDDNGDDQCPDTPGELHGCPDADSDAVADPSDNCPAVANADQADVDADRVGDACDAMPRGDDADGDGIPLLDDGCPQAAGVVPSGCPGSGGLPGPTPTATPIADPVIVSLSAKITPRNCPKSNPKCVRVAKITVKVSRQAKVALKVEQQVRKGGRLVWKRLSVRSLTANAKGSTLTVRGKRGQPRSKYRVTATLANKAKAVNFQV
jgi:subtilisin family serine protease